MKLYTIEKGVKVPPPTVRSSDGQASRAVATMSAMAKGDSFLVKDALESVRAEKQMRDKNAREREAQSGKVFASRRVTGGLRIWRTK